jgi:phosphatidylglycerol---prolipoprotein diacylglyceryl transferase
MHPIIMKIGPLTVYSWGLMLAIGLLSGLFVMLHYAKKEGIKEESVLNLYAYVVIAAIVGARLFYVIGFYNDFKDNILSVFYLNQGGMVFLGGFVAVLLTCMAYARRHDINFWKLMDAGSPGTMLGYAIGRVGCYLNGCCYGVYMFGFVQPTQIYSSIAGLVIFALAVKLYKNKKYDGQIVLFTILFYSIYRFLIEFLRFCPVHIGIFTLNQLMALIMLIVTSWILWKKRTT